LVSLSKDGQKFPSYDESNYPISILITGYDIIFFWVFKMIVLCTYFTKKSPFKNLLLHGLIRDEKGRKMSKSLDNGINPNELIKRYGSDSLRLFLLENNL
jgi:valyl-tRNA synthetase